MYAAFMPHAVDETDHDAPQEHARRSGLRRAIVHYAPWISPPATLLMWFQLRSPELAEDFEREPAMIKEFLEGMAIALDRPFPT